MKKIWIISLFTLVFIFILSWCNHRTEVKIWDETFVLEDATSKNQKICEDLLKSKIHSDKYVFSTFLERKVPEDNDWAHALYWNVEISTAKVSLWCVIYESGRAPELYTGFPPLIVVDWDEVVIEYEALNWKITYEDHLEPAINTLLSYPYASNWYSKTWWFWTDLPKFKKIRYVWETQTEKDKEFCRFVPWEWIHDECYEFIVDWQLISTEWEIKELKNYPIMVTKWANWDLMISAWGFRGVTSDDDINLTESHSIILSKKWKPRWSNEYSVSYDREAKFWMQESDNWYVYFYEIPRWSNKKWHIIVSFLSDKYIWTGDIDLKNSEYKLKVNEDRNPYYPYFLIPKLGMTWSVDYMKLRNDFEIECRDIENFIDLDKRNCNLWEEIDRDRILFALRLKDWINIERLDDSDWCDKFSWYENRYIIKKWDIWCWIAFADERINVKNIYYR